MDRKRRVMIIDDESPRAQGWLQQLQELNMPSLHFEAPNLASVNAIFDALHARRKAARARENWREIGCDLDSVDILLIDFDLIDIRDQTGEELAYLARVLSSVKVVCVINQFGTNRYDLTMVSDLNTRSDLDIGGDQITNPGLWVEAPWCGFRPWHWPVLTAEIEQYERRVADVQASLETKILDMFGFDATSSDPIRMLAKSALSYFQCDPNNLTFTSLFSESTPTFVHPKDASWLGGDAVQTARVAAFVVHKWLERWVLARQDVLIDIPHLIARRPWLLTEPKDVNAWQSTIGLAPEAKLLPALASYRFNKDHWLSRPAYWGEAINADPGLAFPSEEWSFDGIPELVFCEDIASFRLRDQSREFVCELGSSYDLRYICDPEKIEDVRGVNDPKTVEYTPSVRLAM